MPRVPVIPLPARTAAVVVLRLGIAAVFLWAAVPKLLDPAAFAEDIANYHVLPDALVGPAAIALPVIELLVAIALVTGVHAPGAALLAGAMMLVFAGAMGQAIARGIDLDCGCFGEATQTRVSGLTIARNLVLAIACVPIVLFRAPRPVPPAPPPGAGEDPAPHVTS